MLLVVRNGLSAGGRGAWRTGLGCCLGISVHATAAVLGLSAIFRASPAAYTTVRLAGPAYLAYLGMRMLIPTLRREPAPSDTAEHRPAGHGPPDESPVAYAHADRGPADAVERGPDH